MICNSKLFYDLESIFFQDFLGGPVELADTKRTPENYMKLVHRSREGSKEFRLCFSRMGGVLFLLLTGISGLFLFSQNNQKDKEPGLEMNSG